MADGGGRPAPLAHIRVVEFAALGPVAHAGLMLASMGARIDRIDRPDPADDQRISSRSNVLNRGRRSIAIDLKTDEGRQAAFTMMRRADVIMEGHRPGVMERLGLGPEEVHAENPGAVYARMSGWGHSGSRVDDPGHDVNYLAASGLLDAIGTVDSGPVPPLMLVGDFGGGQNLAYAIVCALLERAGSGQGQVVMGSIHESAMSLGSFIFGAVASGRWSSTRGTNMVDTGAHFYNVYRTRDERWLSVGAIEAPFYSAFLAGLGLSPEEAPQWDRDRWPELKARIAGIISSRDLAEWEREFAGTSACVEPIRNVTEVIEDGRAAEAGSIVQTSMGPLPRVSPRMSRSRDVFLSPSPEIGEHSEEIAAELARERNDEQ